MAIDVTEGDILVSGSNEYSIRIVDSWTLRRGGYAITRQATETYSTKRSPAISSGKRGVPVENLASVLGTPLDPSPSSDILQRVELDTPYKAKQTFLYDGGSVYYHLLLEDLRR